MPDLAVGCIYNIYCRAFHVNSL